jgi:hypothetical protein
LIVRGPHLRLRMRERRLRLILPRAQLIVVHCGDDIARVDAVSFADADFENAATEFRRDGRFIGLDSTTQRDHAVLDRASAMSPPQPDRRHGDDNDKSERNKTTAATGRCSGSHWKGTIASHTIAWSDNGL